MAESSSVVLEQNESRERREEEEEGEGGCGKWEM